MATINLLDELHARAGMAEVKTPLVEGGTTPSHEISEHVKLYDPIKKGMEQVHEATLRIERLNEQEKTRTSVNERQDIMKTLDGITMDTSAITKAIKDRLDSIKAMNDKFDAQNPNSALTQMRNNLYQTHIRKFHQIINSYNQAVNDFKNELKARSRRELEIVDNRMRPEEIEKIVDSGRADEYFAAALSENLDNVVRDIEERHKGIVKLENTVLEIYKLFQDLAVLVDVQQETLDVIETRVNNAKDYTGQAVVDLRKGEEYQRSARKKMWCLVFIVLIILAVILGPTLATQLSKS